MSDSGYVAERKVVNDEIARLQQRVEALEEALSLALRFAGPRVGEISVIWEDAYQRIVALRDRGTK